MPHPRFAKVLEHMNTPPDVVVFGPASLSNLGPGYDTLGLCIAGIGDVAEAWRTERAGVRLVRGTGPELPLDASRNTAGLAAALVWKQAEADGGMVLRLRKGIPLGSGIGGSAASAVAGAWAANLLLGRPFSKSELVDAVLRGEALASDGALHGDNALPALMGGLILTSAAKPSDFRRIPLSRPLSLAVLLPSVKVLTGEARAMLPEAVALGDAVRNASDLAFVVHAFSSGSLQGIGRYMMRDRLVEPVRGRLLPFYEPVRAAAMQAGATACAITGSGPALFAIAETPGVAHRVLAAMRSAAGVECRGLVTEADEEGVREVDD